MLPISSRDMAMQLKYSWFYISSGSKLIAGQERHWRGRFSNFISSGCSQWLEQRGVYVPNVCLRFTCRKQCNPSEIQSACLDRCVCASVCVGVFYAFVCVCVCAHVCVCACECVCVCVCVCVSEWVGVQCNKLIVKYTASCWPKNNYSIVHDDYENIFTKPQTELLLSKAFFQACRSPKCTQDR